MESIQDLLDINQKKVLLRLDLNVPLKDGKITDTTRIDKILPTIKLLLKNKAKIIILSHIGRPKGKIVEELSLKPVCEYLQNKINENVRLVKKKLKEINPLDLFKEPNEKIIMLENLRFYAEEEENHKEFAKNLSILGDIYVNLPFLI